MLFPYLLNFNRTVFLHTHAILCLLVLIQWRQHTGPRYLFTRLPQQTVSCQSQSNVLQEDTDGRRNNKHSVITYIYEDNKGCPTSLTIGTHQPVVLILIMSHNVWLSAQSGVFSLAASLFCPPPQVMINNGFTPDKEDYEFCTKVDNMVIPSDGFFGISAATGGLAGIVLFPVLKTLKVVS